MQSLAEIKNKSGQNYIAYLILALTLLLIVRLLPLFKSPLSTYGYDYGFYLYALKHSTAFDWRSLLTGYWGGFNSPLFTLFNSISLPPEATLSLMQVTGALALGIAAYLFFPKNQPKAKIWAIVLVAFSISQNLVFIMFLWKTVIALPFLVLGFKFLTEKKYKFAVLCSLVILLTHRTTAIVYIAVAIIYLLYEQIKAKRYKLIAASFIGTILAVILFWPLLHAVALALLSGENSNITTGYFLGVREWMLLAWPYIVLTLTGLYFWWKNKQSGLMIVFLVLCFGWVALRLPFFHRIIIYVDLALIFFSAYFLSTLNLNNKKIQFATTIVFIFLAYKSTAFVQKQVPLISGSETAEIKNFNQPGGFVLAVSSTDGPWLLGFLNNMRLGAPGLFENSYSQQEWENFWTGTKDEQVKFLAAYPKPLYIYQRSFQLSGDIEKCLQPVSKNFYKYTCN